jgi:hypothetical protein
LSSTSQHQGKGFQKLSLLKGEGKSLLYLSKISGTTYIARYTPIAIDQANHGHCEDIFSHFVFEVKGRIKKTN